MKRETLHVGHGEQISFAFCPVHGREFAHDRSTRFACGVATAILVLAASLYRVAQPSYAASLAMLGAAVFGLIVNVVIRTDKSPLSAGDRRGDFVELQGADITLFGAPAERLPT